MLQQCYNLPPFEKQINLDEEEDVKSSKQRLRFIASHYINHRRN